MPRNLVYDVDVDVPAAEMYGFFTTIGYWEDLVGFYRRNASRTEIAHFSSDQTGTDVAFTHILSAQDLPPDREERHHRVLRRDPRTAFRSVPRTQQSGRRAVTDAQIPAPR